MGFRNTRTGRSLRADMNEIAADFRHIVNELAPAEAEEKLQELASESFEKEQFQDGSPRKKWQSRKDQDAGKARKNRRALLVKSGEGRRSIDSFKSKNVAGIGTDVEYMKVHNEGLKSGRGKGFTMPQRQIISKPGEENKALSGHMDKFLDKKGDERFK